MVNSITERNNQMTRIGEKVILWKEQYSGKAYTDQLGITHDGYIVPEEYIVTIVEEKPVRAMWGQETYMGYRALTDDGKEFTLNWSSFPDDSMTPTYYWNGTYNNSEEPWMPVDALQASNSHIPHVDEHGNKKIPVGAKQCEKHNEVYLDQCWKCQYLDAKGK
jgi:hypothetical protein